MEPLENIAHTGGMLDDLQRRIQSYSEAIAAHAVELETWSHQEKVWITELKRREESNRLRLAQSLSLRQECLDLDQRLVEEERAVRGCTKRGTTNSNVLCEAEADEKCFSARRNGIGSLLSVMRSLLSEELSSVSSSVARHRLSASRKRSRVEINIAKAAAWNHHEGNFCPRVTAGNRLGNAKNRLSGRRAEVQAARMALSHLSVEQVQVSKSIRGAEQERVQLLQRLKELAATPRCGNPQERTGDTMLWS
jgi:hypothetical protein